MPIGPIQNIAPNTTQGSLQDRLARLSRIFPAQGDDTGLTGTMPGSFQRIEAGAPYFDPSSRASAPVPQETQMSPSQFAGAFRAGPGEIGGGIEGTAGLPFSAQIGLGTGFGAGGGAPVAGGVQPSSTAPAAGGTSAVVGNMLSQTRGEGGPAGGAAGAAGGFAAGPASVGFDPYGRATIGPTNIEGPYGFTASSTPGVQTGPGADVSYGGAIGGNPAIEASGGWGGGGFNSDRANSLLAQGRQAMAAGDWNAAMAAFEAADQEAGGALGRDSSDTGYEILR